MKPPKVLAIVLAGGEGKRLYPLTAERAKPSVSFGGRNRIVDFVLSNLINSGIHSIYVLAQYKSKSLINYIRDNRAISSASKDHFISVISPQTQSAVGLYRGTADAVYQNLSMIDLHKPDMVAVFSADHIYRMNVQQLMNFHLECNADATVSAIPVPLGMASAFGILEADSSNRIRQFQEKPIQASPMPNDPTKAYASMGNYIFKTDVLVNMLEQIHQKQGSDFGYHLLPEIISKHRVYAYNFATNYVPGIKAYEEPCYWRDLGTIDAYFDAHQDLLGREPRFELWNHHWPIIGSTPHESAAKVLNSQVDNTICDKGVVIKNAKVRNSVLHRGVVIEEGAELNECIVMDSARIKRGARLHRVIVGAHNTIEPNVRVGYYHEKDAKQFHISEGGIVIIPDATPNEFSQEQFRKVAMSA